jgi:CBS domain-containing protein
MSKPVSTIRDDATVAEAGRRVESGNHSAYPLVDADGRCVGIVTRGDLLAAGNEHDKPVTAWRVAMS